MVKPCGLFAPSYRDPVTARVHELAQRHGLRLVPAAYQAACVGSLGAETVRITPDGAEGPFVVRRLLLPPIAGLSSGVPEVEISSGGRRLTDGPIDSVSWALGQNTTTTVAADLPAPILVRRGDTLAVTIRDATGTTIANAPIVAVGHHVRLPDGQRAAEPADAWAEAIADDGEFYACGVSLAASGKDSQNVNGRVLVQRFALTTTATSTVRVDAGNLTITPPTGVDGVGSLQGDLLVLDDVRHVMRAGERLTLQASAAARVVAFGRRERVR